jgi:uncharacterized protein YndB with AHSA1/START domain
MTVQTHELFIRTDAQKLWKAMIEGAQTERYFFGSFVKSTFTPGAVLEYTRGEGGPMMVEGKVLEVEPARRLVHTWVVRYDPTLANETSTVTWVMEPRGENVKVTLTHDFARAPLTTKQLATDGWSIVLSSLKSMLETGSPLAMPASDM